jgi:DNA (cytosine-5)-methyltransferase 1
MPAESSLTCVDLFCGAGGLTLGLQQAGFTSLFAVDTDPHACRTYRDNIGEHVLGEDVGTLDADRIAGPAGSAVGEPTLVCGGPPCQGFSLQRRGRPADPRNDLVIVFLRLATALNPWFILLENVPALLGQRGRPYLDRGRRLLDAAGYRHQARVLDAADYGVPQHRERAFLVAWRGASEFSFPPPTHFEATWRTVRDAIGDLPEPPEDYSEHPAHANHRRVAVSALNLQRLAHVPPGGGRLDIPAHLQLPCHRNANGHRHLDVYGRMHWAQPAPTITAMFDNFTRGRFGHPEQTRSVTAREGARLQSFPDSFHFRGPKKDVARQIGNAVPPLLARRLGEAIVLASGRACCGKVS